MSKDDKTTVEKHIDSKSLEGLIKAGIAVSSRIGEERGAFGDKVKKAINEKHLNKFAFDVVTKLYKMDSGKAAMNIRALMLYVDHLGLNAQGDLEDLIDRQAEEEAEDGGDGGNTEGGEGGDEENFDDPVRRATSASTANPDAALSRFRGALADAPNSTAVERGLQRFVKDFPDLADKGHEIAEERLRAMSAAPVDLASKRKAKNKGAQDAPSSVH